MYYYLNDIEFLNSNQQNFYLLMMKLIIANPSINILKSLK